MEEELILHNEVDEISEQDLQAASAFYDSLLNGEYAARYLEAENVEEPYEN